MYPSDFASPENITSKKKDFFFSWKFMLSRVVCVRVAACFDFITRNFCFTKKSVWFFSWKFVLDSWKFVLDSCIDFFKRKSGCFFAWKSILASCIDRVRHWPPFLIHETTTTQHIPLFVVLPVKLTICWPWLLILSLFLMQSCIPSLLLMYQQLILPLFLTSYIITVVDALTNILDRYD